MAGLVALAGPAAGQVLPDLRGEVNENVLGVPGARDRAVPAAGSDDDPAQAGRARGDRPVSAAGLAVDGSVTIDLDDDAATLPEDDARVITGSVAQAPEETADVLSGRAEPAARAAPVQTGVGVPEDDPFAPLGLRIGTFDVNTTLEIGATALRTRTSVADPGPPPSLSDEVSTGVLGEIGLDVRAVSDWSRHALELDLAGRLPFPVSGEEDDEPTLDLSALLRLDLGLDTTLTARAGYGYSRDDPASAAFFVATDPVLFPGIEGTNTPDKHALTGSLALSRDIGPVTGEAEASVAREIHGAAALSDGSSVSQGDLDFTRVGLRLRGGLDTAGVLAPFAEAEFSQRLMDERPDTAGLDRNATRYAGRVGIALNRGEKLNGEVAIGYVYEDIADPTLADIGGVSLDGALNWSPRRGTDLRIGLRTTTQSSGAADVSGSVNYAGTMSATHRARANLQLEGEASLDYEDVTGANADTVTAAASVGATVWLNRFVGLSGRIGHEKVFSSDPTERSESSNAFVGLRMQR
ncbi:MULTISPECIES: outer membrane beta-barrel protein [unclassified Roseitalea]|uniref:outer membrane beta-barrel protein n=1 Tax=unclassified Roseitalea TaxID=2639107 RepID=UPI00273E8113|nr:MULTISPECIES: outer membrane beta-barrel protein [unclassified Roseitalea]